MKKSKKIDSEARRISVGLVKDVLETMFETGEMEVETTDDQDSIDQQSVEEDELLVNTRPKRTARKRPGNTDEDKMSGVFSESENVVPASEIPRLGSRIVADNVSSVVRPAESNKAILDSLPVIEKLRSLSRQGSVKDDCSVSEVGSDRDSVSSGVLSRAQRRIKAKKSVSKSNGKKKVNTRSSKGKGRRTMMKKKPVKSVSSVAVPSFTTSDRVYHDAQFWNTGDIVSVVNLEDDDIYYCQLRGFLTDQYSDKYAVITWLLPTQESPPPNEGFHPATYILGPEEELPRRMEVFSFVMHAPDDYFYNRRAPYSTTQLPSDSNYTSVRLGPRLRKNVDGKDIFVGLY